MANYLTSDTNAYFYSSTEVTNSLQVGTWEVKKDEDKDKKYEDKNDSKNEDSIIKEQDGAEKDKTSEANQKPGEQDQFPESNNQTSEKESNNETDDSIKDNHIQEIQIDQSSKSNPTFDQNKTNSIDSKQNWNNN